MEVCNPAGYGYIFEELRNLKIKYSINFVAENVKWISQSQIFISVALRVITISTEPYFIVCISFQLILTSCIMSSNYSPWIDKSFIQGQKFNLVQKNLNFQI